jgi:ABC-type transport system involved in cytochrome c biogenesis permease subunit
MTRSVALLLSLGLSASLPAADLDAVRAIAVQDGGRLKPLDTFARETARRVGGARAFGAESMASKEPVEWLVAMMADPAYWKTVPMVRVAQADLRGLIGLPADRDRFSFDELVRNPTFLSEIEKLQARFQGGAEPKLTPREEALSSLYNTLNLLAGIYSTEGLMVVPAGADHGDEWTSLVDPHGARSAQRVRLLASSLFAAYRSGDGETVRGAGAALAARLAELSPDSYPSGIQLGREVSYNRLKPFRLAWMFYVVGAALALARLAVRRPTTLGLWIVGAGWLLHTYGLALRTLIAGRAPVTNMYESVVFVAWGAVLFALLFEWTQRVGYAGAAAAVLAVAALVTADSVPIMDGAIAPLVPVLRDNFWLTTHVLTISLGYAALLLGAGLGHVSLAVWLLAPDKARTSRLPILIYRALQAGTLLLAAGTLLGGVWASYSWGRFWGWDPKETWALIALLGYLSLLHARSAGVLRDFGMAVGSVLSFLLVLMAWYGVNFILGTGLHSYGFGSGGYGYVAAFAGTELAIVVFALMVWRRRHPRVAAAAGTHAPAQAHPGVS